MSDTFGSSKRQKAISTNSAMNQEESLMHGYEATAEETQKMILEWATTTEAFHRRYEQLNQVVNSLQMVARRQPAEKVRLRKLIDLREHMSDVLMTLLLDMSSQKQGRAIQASKQGQLLTHASLLKELNQKIDVELLGYTTVAQA